MSLTCTNIIKTTPRKAVFKASHMGVAKSTACCQACVASIHLLGSNIYQYMMSCTSYIHYVIIYSAKRSINVQSKTSCMVYIYVTFLRFPYMYDMACTIYVQYILY